MAEPGRGRGGRGAIIAKLIEMQKRPGPPESSPPPSFSGPPSALPSDSPSTTSPVVQPPQVEVSAPAVRVGGRGALLKKLQQLTSQPGPPPQSTAISEFSDKPEKHFVEPPKPVSCGRGRLLELALAGQRQIQPSAIRPVESSPSLPSLASAAVPASSTIAPTPSSEDSQVKEVTGRFREIEIDRNPTIMRGKDGREVEAYANYIPLYLLPGRGIFEYEVRFSPLVDDRALIDKMLFCQHRDILGGKRRTFDGVTLYVPRKLEVTSLESIHPITNEKHTISLIFRRGRSMGECTHMYNVLFKNIQRELQMVQLNREYFSQELAYAVPQHRLEIWPGYITAVDAFEGGIMLNCNATHKVLRTQTVLGFMDDVIHKTNGIGWKDIVQKELIGQSVMTRSPVKIYRIDDIDFSQNPMCTFKKQDGTEMTYVEYHRRKNIEIKDHQQPLLIHRPKPSKRPGGTALLSLIPELCYMTGLTDDMRADFKVMKDVAMYTRVNPNQRVRALQKFIDSIKSNPNCVKMLDEWGLRVPESPVKMSARVLNPEKLKFGGNHEEPGSANADWNRLATSRPMLEVVDISDWLVVHTVRDERYAINFIEMMSKVCPQMGVDIKYPVVSKIRDDKTESYLRQLRESLSGRMQLVVIIFPSQREDRYSAVKKLCCVDRPIPSQVINSRTISKPDKLRSIVQKIALQINCKLGGALWSVNIPFKNAMICGIDSYHDSKTRSQSVAGFVASLNPAVTRWHSQVFIQSSDREFLDGIIVAMGFALNKYKEVNGHYPDTVLIYRDGVGDGQLKVCQEHEVASLQLAFSRISPDYSPLMAFIVCQKRINTRIFVPSGPNNYENPPPGSVVDHTVTRRYLYDFFLVSQMVRQGTVTPTHYIVLHNSTHLDPDKIQKLTYKMCHLYYNWPGTIRVPAPCQYAHKLAHLVGVSIHKEPAQSLCDKLFFL